MQRAIKTVRNGERLGKFESERNNASERIAEKVHNTVTVRSRFKNERATVILIC
jgi:hypothetical protein